MTELSLAGDFPKATEADWLALARKALGDAPFDHLRTRLDEGFETDPLYIPNEENAPLPLPRGWQVVQILEGDSPSELKALAEQAAASGASAFRIDFNAGAAPERAADLAPLLSPQVACYLAGGTSAAEAALAVAAADIRGGEGLVGCAGLDPVTRFALSGEIPAERALAFADEVDAAFALKDRAPRFVPFLASDRAWHGAGASAVEELAFTLAAAVAYWRALLAGGMAFAGAPSAIAFSLSATADLFLTVAKFRAVRLLWARALEAAGADALAQPTVLAEMSTRILAAYDPHVNLLRGTAAAFAASVGGANAVAVHAFDAVRGAQTAFSNRLARNTGLVLQHEAYLAAVADASAGSAYVERLTDELASRAWSLFQSVEAKGGLLEALATGFVHGAIEKVAQSRSAAIARRERKITGVSAFPDLAECIKPALRQTVRRKAADETDTKAPVAALPLPGQGVRFTALVAAAKDGASLARLRALAHRVAEPLRRALPPKTRDAEPFELLRRRSDIALDRIGSRPPVFLATFGKPEEHRARASWVQSFFAVGGIQTVEADESVEGVAAIAAAFKKSPAPIACLCASNAAYEAMPDLASALKEAGATFVYLAAPPKVLARLADRYASAVDRLIYEGCDALALLQEAHRILKVDELAEAAVDEEEPGFDDTNGTGFREGPSMDLTR